ncbi:hypothetical protein PFISCL1PPCAC_6098, partial [Pristionchus fissidentatus]
QKTDISLSETLLSLDNEPLEKSIKSDEITSESSSPLGIERMEEDTESATSTDDNESDKQESTSSETETELACAEC